MRSLLNIIFFRIFRVTLYSTIAMTFCAWIMQSSKYLHMLDKNNLSFAKFFKFASYLSVDIAAVILPISLSISSALVFYRFAESNQLTAMKSSGMSPAKLLYPLMLLSSIITAYLYVSNAYISPKSWTEFRAMEFQIRNNINAPESAGSIFSSDKFSIYAQQYVENFSFKNIFIIDSRNAHKSYTYFAKSGTINNNILTLTNGERIEIDNINGKNSITNFDLYKYNLREIMDNVKEAARPNEKFLCMLLADTGDESLNKAQIALFHQKLVSPLLTIIFSLLSFMIILQAPHVRKKSYVRMFFLILLIIIYQGVFFWIANASARNHMFIYWNYLLILSSICTLQILIFLRNKK